MLKGGLVLELRLARARTTKDIDLRMMGEPGEILERLQSAGRIELGDFMRFEVQRDRRHPLIQGDGMKYSGHRFAAECRLAGKIYGRPFGIDIGFGDPLVGDPDEIVTDDLLAFAGVPPAKVRVYPVASHIAEKLHAYTLRRPRPNSRIKDLPDIALLGTAGSLPAATLRSALETTFKFRGTHSLPVDLPQPPENWRESYAVMANSDELDWQSLDDVYVASRTFLEPVLSGRERHGTWSPAEWRWSPNN